MQFLFKCAVFVGLAAMSAPHFVYCGRSKNHKDAQALRAKQEAKLAAALVDKHKTIGQLRADFDNKRNGARGATLPELVAVQAALARTEKAAAEKERRKKVYLERMAYNRKLHEERMARQAAQAALAHALVIAPEAALSLLGIKV